MSYAKTDGTPIKTIIKNGLRLRDSCCAKTHLEIETPTAGKNQPIHPKVLYFPEGFGGHVFWMAFTPFPNQDGQQENPCIACSDDGVTFYAPCGVENPLDPTPSAGYNSDTHLVYREDLNRLEVWWRWWDATDTESIYRRTSTDGINWTEKEQCYQIQNAETKAINALCPTVIYENSKYLMWIGKGTTNYLVLLESSDGLTWTTKGTTNIKGWHFDIIHTSIGYECLMCPSTDTPNLKYATSSDGLTWTDLTEIMRNSVSGFDCGRIYRSSFVKIGDTYYIYYTGVDADDTWTIGLTIGTLDDLHGYDSGMLILPSDAIVLTDGNVIATGQNPKLSNPVLSIENLDMSVASGVYTADMPIADDDTDFSIVLKCTTQKTGNYNIMYCMKRTDDVKYGCYVQNNSAFFGVEKAFGTALASGQTMYLVVTHESGESVKIQKKIGTSIETLESTFRGGNYNKLMINKSELVIDALMYFDRILTPSEIEEFLSS